MWFRNFDIACSISGYVIVFSRQIKKKPTLNSKPQSAFFSLNTEYPNDKLCNCSTLHANPQWKMVYTHTHTLIYHIVLGCSLTFCRQFRILSLFHLSSIFLTERMRFFFSRTKRNDMQAFVIFVIIFIRVQHHHIISPWEDREKEKNYHRSFIYNILFWIDHAHKKKNYIETMTQLKWLLLLAQFLTVVRRLNDRVSCILIITTTC